MSSEVTDQLAFEAELVSALQKEFTSDYVVHGIHFGSGDPEAGGQHWNFSRTLCEDDDGVCTVKEIQQVTVYGGITSFSMTRTKLVCEFDDTTSRETGTRRLEITYGIDDETWAGMVEQAEYIFKGEDYFVLER